MAQSLFILPHPIFDLKEAKKIAIFYARCDKSYTIVGLAERFSLDRKQLYRYLKVSIIFSLISEEDVNKIIDKRASSFNKSTKTQKMSLIKFEKMIELAEERQKLQKKLNFFKGCFGKNPNAEVVIQECITRLKEIERYAFQ